MSEQKPALPPEFVDVYPTEGRRVRIETGELLPSGHVLRGVRRTTCLLRLERDGDVVLKPHEAEQAEEDFARFGVRERLPRSRLSCPEHEAAHEAEQEEQCE